MAIDKNRNTKNRAKKESLLKRTLQHPLGASIYGSFFASLCLLCVTYFFAYLDIRQDIKHIRSNIELLSTTDSCLNKKLKDIFDNFIMKDEGIEIEVGVSSELNRNNVSVYKGNNDNLKFCDGIILTNSIHDLKPSIKLVVGLVRDKDEQNSENSKADIFISKDAAETLGFKDYKKTGIMKMNLKKLPKE
jgi:hypothetical protein